MGGREGGREEEEGEQLKRQECSLSVVSSSLTAVAGPALEGCVWKVSSWLDRGEEGRRGREEGRRRRGGGGGGTVSPVSPPCSWEGGADVGVAREVVEGGSEGGECESASIHH